nr:hypothetical protein [Magnetospirillum sp. SS-4]
MAQTERTGSAEVSCAHSCVDMCSRHSPAIPCRAILKVGSFAWALINPPTSEATTLSLIRPSSRWSPRKSRMPPTTSTGLCLMSSNRTTRIGLRRPASQ